MSHLESFFLSLFLFRFPGPFIHFAFFPLLFWKKQQQKTTQKGKKIHLDIHTYTYSTDSYLCTDWVYKNRCHSVCANCDIKILGNDDGKRKAKKGKKERFAWPSLLSPLALRVKKENSISCVVVILVCFLFRDFGAGWSTQGRKKVKWH